LIIKINCLVIGCNAGECLSCANEGICLLNGTCLCKFGFSGDNCENCKKIKLWFIINQLYWMENLDLGCNAGGKLACENGGICQHNGHCECVEGFTGLTCCNYL
jgi:hypothetical protein